MCSRASAECVTTSRSTATSTGTGHRRTAASASRSASQHQDSTPIRRKRRRSSSQDNQHGPRTPLSPQPLPNCENSGTQDVTLNAREVLQPVSIRDIEHSLITCVQDSYQIVSANVATPSRAAINNVENTQVSADSARPPIPQRSRASASYLLNALPSESVMLQFLEEYMNSVRRISRCKTCLLASDSSAGSLVLSCNLRTYFPPNIRLRPERNSFALTKTISSAFVDSARPGRLVSCSETPANFRHITGRVQAVE